MAFWAGDFLNSAVLARMKVWTQGHWLWTRTIGSTIVGEGADSLLFYPLAFWGFVISFALMVGATCLAGVRIDIKVSGGGAEFAGALQGFMQALYGAAHSH